MSFHIPTAAELEQYRADADKIIEAVTTVLDAVEKYGSFIPGLSSSLAVVEGIDAALKTAKTFIDHIPV